MGFMFMKSLLELVAIHRDDTTVKKRVLLVQKPSKCDAMSSFVFRGLSWLFAVRQSLQPA
jgi:hypothetical protein